VMERSSFVCKNEFALWDSNTSANAGTVKNLPTYNDLCDKVCDRVHASNLH
jgi:hypothetical protein